MRVLVVGAGRVGTKVIRQLQKNSNLKVLTADPHDKPYAVQQGVITAVDIQEALTPFTLSYILEKTTPDLVLLTRSTEDLGLGKAPGMDVLVNSLRKELAALSHVPMIEVARMGQ